MKRNLILFALVPIIFLSACSLKTGAPSYNSPEDINSPGREAPIACTMEAKICPDGSVVGRSGPNCEFGPCSEKNLSSETSTLKVYFGNSNLNPNSVDCNKVYSVFRSIGPKATTPSLALQELFKGPTESEKNNGYTSWFSEETRDVLKNIKVANGLAEVDLMDIRQIIPNASASCGSAQLLAQMEATLKDFPEIKNVIFSINGQPDIFYEWLQLSTPKYK